MRMLDNDHAVATRSVALYLNRQEAEALRDRIARILTHPSEHGHVQDQELKREISISIYDEKAKPHPDRYNPLERRMFLEG